MTTKQAIRIVKETAVLSSYLYVNGELEEAFNIVMNNVLTDEKIEKIADLLETEWGYEGIREDVSRILREADNDKVN